MFADPLIAVAVVMTTLAVEKLKMLVAEAELIVGEYWVVHAAVSQ